jgi:predicted MPP superfamily phosphohydrolase
LGRWLRAAVGAGAIAGVAVLCHSVFLAPRGLRINRRDVVLPRLARAFDGYRILHLSDLHLGSLASGAEQALVAATLPADLVVVTGDMVERVRDAEPCGRLLASIESRDGIVCIPGNHDNKAIRRAHGSQALWETLRSHGIRTLINDAFAIERNGNRLWIVGVDDPYEGRSDLTTACASVRRGETAILLAHSPDIASSLPVGLADLVMTGHCHGGQVRTPFGPILTRTHRRFPDVLGLQRIDGTLYQMSGGLGSSIPLRFLCPPEATLLRLVAPKPASAS